MPDLIFTRFIGYDLWCIIKHDLFHMTRGNYFISTTFLDTNDFRSKHDQSQPKWIKDGLKTHWSQNSLVYLSN